MRGKTAGPVGDRQRALLLELAGRDTPATSVSLVHLIGVPGTRYNRQSWANNLLRSLESRGLVSKSGGRYTGYRWQVTELGAIAAQQITDIEKRHTDLKAAQQKAAAAIAGFRSRGYGPSTSPRERAEAAVKLSEAGCSYPQIGRLFGVTGERIRQQVNLTRRRGSRLRS